MCKNKQNWDTNSYCSRQYFDVKAQIWQKKHLTNEQGKTEVWPISPPPQKKTIKYPDMIRVKDIPPQLDDQDEVEGRKLYPNQIQIQTPMESEACTKNPLDRQHDAEGGRSIGLSGR